MILVLTLRVFTDLCKHFPKRKGDIFKSAVTKYPYRYSLRRCINVGLKDTMFLSSREIDTQRVSGKLVYLLLILVYSEKNTKFGNRKSGNYLH